MFTTDWRMWGAAKLFDVRHLPLGPAGRTGSTDISQGFSIGFNQATLSTYISELAPTNARGSLLAMYQLWVSVAESALATINSR